jgi:hypothetical protein
MSGKKQHHIPQSLQRGFLFDKKAERTYVYRKSGNTFLASIRDVAAQRYFYSRVSSDGSKTLDDHITEYEDRLGAFLIKLRNLPVNSIVEADVAAEVVAHLTPRTAHTRRMFGRGIGKLMTAVAEIFTDEDSFLKLLGLEEPEPSVIWNKHIQGFLEKSPQIKARLELLPIPLESLNRILFIAAKEHFVSNFEGISSSFKVVFKPFLNGLDDFVRDNHNKSLGKGNFMEIRKASLAVLQWSVRSAPNEGAVLPDCVALGLDKTSSLFQPYLMTETDSLSAVVMPITSEKLLVGTRIDHSTPNFSSFNDDAAACSNELFIASSQGLVFEQLGTRIGIRWTSMLDSAVQEALQEVVPNKNLFHDNLRQPPALAHLNYQLTFAGLGTEESVAPISEKIQSIISKVHPLFNLERLDGITFTTEFQRTLDNLDRGFEANIVLDGLADDIADGVATSLVVRDGVAKVRIVLNAAYGWSLLGEHQQDAEVALHLIVAGLTQVCTMSQIETALPGFLLKPIMMDDHDGLLHCAVHRALRAYRYAHDSAEFGASNLVEQEFSKYFVTAFENAYLTIAKAKEEHAAVENFPKLFETSIRAASDMLLNAARLIGHRHGMGQFEIPTAETGVGAIILMRQLSGWMHLFAKDLRRFWQNDSWKRSDFFGLNIHCECLLWANEIILYRSPNGKGTMIMAVSQQ